MRSSRIIRKINSTLVSLALIAATSVAQAALTNQNGEVVGTTDGEFQVTPTGAATYSIPIKVPAGIGDMQPGLSISYSTQGGNGLLGVGWSLMGLSAITPCSQLYSLYGSNTRVQFDENDALCLDGQRLILTSNDAIYREHGSKYHKQVDDFSETTYQNVGGQESFIVETKSGLIKEYGTDGLSILEARRVDDTTINMSPKIWLLNKISDTKGNSIYFSYMLDQENGSQLIDEIKYTAPCKDISCAVHMVKFNYEDRTDTRTGYDAGTKNTFNKRLSSIEVKQNGANIRRYNFTYEYESVEVNARSILTSIQECAWKDAIPECLPSTIFSWNQRPDFDFGERTSTSHCADNAGGSVGCDSHDNYISVRYPDLDADGYADICYRRDDGLKCYRNISGISGSDSMFASNPVKFYFYSTQSSSYVEGVSGCGSPDMVINGYTVPDYDSNQCRGLEFVDVNRDGTLDIVYVTAEGEIRIKLFYKGAFYEVPVGTFFGSSALLSAGHGVEIGDINGDMFVDLCAGGVEGSLFKCAINHPPSQDFRPDHSEFDFESAKFEFDISIAGSGNNNGICANGVCYCSGVPCEYLHNRRSVRLRDANGDGKSDIMLHNDAGIAIYTSNGDGTFTLFSQSNICGEADPNSTEPWPVKYGCTNTGNFNYIYFININGDKHTDLCYRSKYFGITCRLGTGLSGENYWAAGTIHVPVCSHIVSNPDWVTYNADFIAPDHACSVDQWDSMRFIDINADGKDDFIYVSETGLRTWISTGSSYIEKTNSITDLCVIDSTNYGECDDTGIKKTENFNTIQFADFNGDANLDMAYRGDLGVQIWQRDYNPSYVHTITNGLGESIEISSLLPTSRWEVYQGYKSILAMPLWVVKEHKTNAGGNTENTYTHTYFNGRVDWRYGNGFLGFSYTETVDLLTQRVTINYYDADLSIRSRVKLGQNQWIYPLAGRATSSRVGVITGYKDVHVVIDGQSVFVGQRPIYKSILSSSKHYKIKTQVRPANVYTYFTYVEDESTWEFELDQSLVKYTKTTTNLDNYGNVLDTTSTTTNNRQTYSVTTVNEYGLNEADEDGKRFGRMRSAVVTAEFDDSFSGGPKQQTRTTRFTYYPKELGYLLKETIEEPNDPNLYVKTLFEYDEWGNQSRIEISGHRAAQYPIETRSTNSVTDYSMVTSGIVLRTATDAEGLSQLEEMEIQSGGITKLTGPNQVETNWEFDGFYRVKKEIRADNSQSITEYHWCMGNVSCPANALYYIQNRNVLVSDATQNVSAPTTIYYDKLGRKLREESIGFNNRVVVKDTHYDPKGRVSRESIPYFSNSIPEYWSSFQYDAKNRVTVQKNPDNSTVSFKYNGLESIASHERIGENGSTIVKTKQIMNIMGKIEEAYDAHNSRILYAYLPFGELESTTDEYGNTSTLSYDNRGRKMQLDDPDMGIWSYGHDALGNLRWQRDAENQETRLLYDKLNRMVVRRDLASGELSKWNYNDVTQPLGARGKLGSVIKYLGNAALHEESYSYDTLGRLISKSRSFDGVTYTTHTNYDPVFPRTEFVEYPQSMDGASSVTLQIRSEYDQNGLLTRVINHQHPENVFWEAQSTNANGNITMERLGNGLVTLRGFDPARGSIQSISTGAGLSNDIQNLDYYFDSAGNLERRSDHNRAGGTVTEQFAYDGLNRLTTVKENGQVSKYYQYDAIGNMKFNSDLGYYYYGENGAGPHAVSRIVRANTAVSSFGDADADGSINSLDIYLTANKIINPDTSVAGNPDCTNANGLDTRDPVCIANLTGSATQEFISYNANGNMLSGLSGKLVTWTTYNKAETITKGNTSLLFEYNSNRNRFKQIIDRGGNLTTIHYVGKTFEVITDNDGNKQYKNYIKAGGRFIAVKTYYSNQASKLHYIHRDHTGSTDVITDARGAIVERFAYDPFGARKAGVQWNSGLISQAVASYNQSTTTRTYTEHEELSSVGLIHMNGRVYDPELARFTSADPFVQTPNSSQSYNRYSYVFNNPLSFTDPSGYYTNALMYPVRASFFGFFIGVAAFADSIEDMGEDMAIHIALSAIGVPTWVSAFAVTYHATDGDWEAAAIAAVTAAAFQVVNGVAAENGWTNNTRIFAHGMVGGLSNVMQGKKFGYGFMSSAFMQMARQMGLIQSSHASPVSSILAGGTASWLGGEKFANGASSAAFNYMLTGGQGSHEPQGRPLTADEIAAAKARFGNDIDVSMVRIIDDRFVPWQFGYAITPYGNIYWPGECGNLASCGGPRWRNVFLHEMTHVMQFQQGINVFGEGMSLQVPHFLTFTLYDPYEYVYDSNRAFSSYNIEQQGRMVENGYYPNFDFQ